MNDLDPVGVNDPLLWDWYNRALVSPGLIGTPTLPLHVDDPQVGFYRHWSKLLNRWRTVAFFIDEASGLILAERDGEPVKADKVGELWQWCCRFPISYEAYQQANAGQGFAGEPPHGIGHNLPANEDMDERQRLELEYLGERDLALEFLKTPITDQDAADRAAVWAKRLSEIAGRANTLHDTEKRPHLDAGRRVDDRWRDLQQEPAALSKRLKKHQLDWLKEQDRLERERVAAAEAEAARLRREAEDAARQAEEAKSVSADELAEAGKLIAAAKEAERQAEYQRPSAGRTGARVSLRTVKFAVIEDWSALFEWIRANRADLVKPLQAAADTAAKANVALPGCRIGEEQKAV